VRGVPSDVSADRFNILDRLRRPDDPGQRRSRRFASA
jgi:hypothetical protein